MAFKSFIPMAALCILASCNNSSKQNNAEGTTADSVQTSVMSFQDCDLTLGGIHFTKMLNGAAKPFTVSARMKPGFTSDGLYHAADLIVMANDTLYQKFCFEQDERGKHRVVTVRTIGTSDDNNHEVVSQDFIYYKISSDTRTIASYYSLDGKEWQMVRLYRNNYPKDLKVGICSQAPQKGVCVSEFSELSLSTETVGDFRMGE